MIYYIKVLRAVGVKKSLARLDEVVDGWLVCHGYSGKKLLAAMIGSLSDGNRCNVFAQELAVWFEGLGKG